MHNDLPLAVALAFSVMTTPLLMQNAIAVAPESIEITDFIPRSKLVDYPNPFNITVRSNSYAGRVEILLIRHLDGAIVHRRQTTLTKGESWTNDLPVTEPKDDRLGTLVEPGGSKTPFSLVFVNDNLEVVLSHEFHVQVGSSQSLPSHSIWSRGDVTEGEFVRQEGGQFVFRGSEPSHRLNFNFDHNTRFIKKEQDNTSWNLRSDDLRAGDNISVVFTTNHKGEKWAREVRIVSTSTFNRPFLMPTMRFQLGTVSATKQDSTLSSKAKKYLILEVRVPGGTRSWEVTKDTEILFGMSKSSYEYITNGSVIAVGSIQAKDSRNSALRILLLSDLSSIN